MICVVIPTTSVESSYLNVLWYPDDQAIHQISLQNSEETKILKSSSHSIVMFNTYCVASFSGLSIFDCPFAILYRLFVFVLCTLCCQFLWIVYVWLSLRYSLTFICLFLVYHKLPVSLYCLCLIVPSLFSNVYLSFSCVP
jgi:hypothetical protein